MAVEVTHPPSREDALEADRTFQRILKESKRPSILQRGRVLGLYLAAITTLLAAACGPAQATEPTTKAVATSTATPEAPPTATASPTLGPTEVPPTPEPPKPLPEVINNQTVKFVTLSPPEVQKMIKETKVGNELKFPLPAILQQDGVEAKIIHTKAGEQVIALTVTKEGIYNLPALFDGTVARGNRVFPYYDLTLPTSTKASAKQGESFTVGRNMYTVEYNEGIKNTPEYQAYRNFAQQTYVDLPENTIAVLAVFTIDTSQGYKVNITGNMSPENILRAKTGEVVLVGGDAVEPSKQTLQYEVFPAGGGSYRSDILPPTSDWAARSGQPK